MTTETSALGNVYQVVHVHVAFLNVIAIDVSFALSLVVSTEQWPPKFLFV